MPVNGGERGGGNGFCNTVHYFCSPVENVCEQRVDRRAPEEYPPKDAGEHEDIDKRSDDKVADDG